MAARDPYSIAVEDLPHVPADGSISIITRRANGDARIPITLAMTAAGAVVALVAAPAGIPSTGAATLLSVCGLGGMAVFSAAMTGNDGATPAGVALSCAGAVLSGAATMLAASSTVTLAAALGEATLGLRLLFAGMSAASLSCGLRAGRMRDTLWQDVSWRGFDELAHRLLIRPAWEIAHVGNRLKDRYAVVSGRYFDSRSDAPDRKRKRRFLVDLRNGLLAPLLGDSSKVDELRDQGYPIDEVEDKDGRLIRARWYDDGDESFRSCPPKEITASEYYRRVI